MNRHPRAAAPAAALAVLACAAALAASLLALLALLPPLLAPPPLLADETTDKVDNVFAAWDKTTSPGAALAVVRDGRIVYERGYGMAKLEDGVVMTPDRIFDIGSCSKQFTATCLAMLVRDGKVSLDDNVRKHIPELPDYGTPITVRHLLHHTSGLRDYNALLELAGFRGDSDCPTVAEALDVICRQKKLNYAPGAEYSYTNTGYFLLSQIVERVSGKSLNAFAQERIFKPLGMAHTIYQDDHTQVIPKRATGYEPAPDGRGYKIDMSNWDETGDGNVYTSVEDLFLWDQAFYTNALGKDVMDMLQTTGTLSSGKKIDYAFGLVVSDYKGLKVVEHGGAWAGFRAAIVRFPEERFSVICLANLGTMDPSGLAFKVADIYLAGKLREPEKKEANKAEAIAVPEKDLAPLAGNYQEPRFGQWLEITLKDGRLFAGPFRGGRTFALVPTEPGTFEVRQGQTTVRLEFAPSAAGKPAKIRIVPPGVEEALYEKAAPLKPLTPALLAEYAGTYVSHELLDARYEIAVEKGALILRMRTIPGAPLKAMAPDKFTESEFGATIEFVRAKGGKVAGFKLGVGRAAGIEFVK
ncbi:MAG TPA: serine hydrolase [Terriglobales bacterium]|nr:serine hydrolase [Terriglobales bacterium]